LLVEWCKRPVHGCSPNNQPRKNMTIIGYLLAIVAGLGCLVCWVMVLIKMFQNEKPLIGILGVLCGLWAFIWGWMNSTKHNLKKIMLIWTGCFVLSLIGNGIAAAGAKSMIEKGIQDGTIKVETN